MGKKFNKEKFAKDLILKRMFDERTTLRNVGKQIGVSFAMISRYERQECEPRISHLILACEWLGTKIEDYLIE